MYYDKNLQVSCCRALEYVIYNIVSAIINYFVFSMRGARGLEIKGGQILCDFSFI